MKLCGDLLKFIEPSLNVKTKFKIINLSRCIRSVCLNSYCPKIMSEFIDYNDYALMPSLLKQYVRKIKNVGIFDNQKLINSDKRYCIRLNELTRIQNKSLPLGLKYIEFNEHFYGNFSDLPAKLIYMKVGGFFDKRIDSFCSFKHLIYLQLDENLNKHTFGINFRLSNSLKYLIIYCDKFYFDDLYKIPELFKTINNIKIYYSINNNKKMIPIRSKTADGMSFSCKYSHKYKGYALYLWKRDI